MAAGTEADEARAPSVAPCLSLANAWRKEAAVLRGHAARPHLGPAVSAVMLREAEAAERAADWWAAGAERDRR